MPVSKAEIRAFIWSKTKLHWLRDTDTKGRRLRQIQQEVREESSLRRSACSAAEEDWDVKLNSSLHLIWKNIHLEHVMPVTMETGWMSFFYALNMHMEKKHKGIQHINIKTLEHLHISTKH